MAVAKCRVAVTVSGGRAVEVREKPRQEARAVEGGWVDALDRASTAKAKAMEERCGSNLQLPRTRINKGATCRRSRMTERRESSKRDASRCD